MVPPNKRPISLMFAQSRVISSLKSAGSLRTAALLIVFGLLATTFYFPSSATSVRKSRDSRTANAVDKWKSSKAGAKGIVRDSSLLFRKDLELASLMAPLLSAEGIATFAADCTTPKDSFNLGETVCAKASGVPVTVFPWQVLWLDPAGFVRQSDTASTSDATEYRYTVPATATSNVDGKTVDNRGTWRVNLVRANGAVRQTALFTVHEPGNPITDVFVQKVNRSSDAQTSAGSNIDFLLVVGNLGPDTATVVHLVDSVPAGGTLVQFTQQSGPTCVPLVQGPANDCTIATMASGDRAEFTAIYNTGSEAPGTYETSATVSSGTTDPDSSNNTSTATYTVTAASTGSTCDLTCPDNINASADTTENNQRGAHVTYNDPVSSGTCGSVSSTPASGSFFPVGQTVVNVTSETGNGACSFTVTVNDNAQNPTITCPSDKVVTADPGACSATVDPGSPTTTGTGVTVSGERSDGQPLNAPYPGGTTTIVWTATDSQDRTASCSQTITVHTDDTTPPTITAPANVTMSAGTNAQSCGMIVGETELGTATASDNCGGVNISRTGVPAGNFFPIGTTTITYTATDGGGNTATATQTVTVTDDSPPTITATAPDPNPPPTTDDVPIQDVTVHTGPNSTSCAAVVSDADLGNVQARDNCAVTLSRSPSGNTFPVGTTTITWLATDSSGNTGTATQNVTVIDDTPPTITAPADVTAGTGPGRTSCDAEVDLGTPSANDNCAFTVTHSPVGPYPVGTTTVTWTATDASGNINTAIQHVTVIDNTPPVVTPPANIVVQLPLNSTATSMAVNYPNPATATDNCAGPITFVYNPASGSTFSVGTTTVTVTATDAHNNSASATFTVTVLYNFTGFFSPVSNPPTLNAVNAGRAIPVKFSLSGDKGLNIFASGNPYSVSFNCATNDPGVDVTETLNAGGSSLSYGGDQYNYVWKTENSWAGTCRQLVITLNDGSVYTANFKFK